MGVHSTHPAGEPVKLFGCVIQQASGHQMSTPLKAPASPCSDGSDTETWRPEQPRGLYWPACQPPPRAQQTIAVPPTDSLRSDSILAMQDAAATLSRLGSFRSVPLSPPAQPVAKPTIATIASRRRPSAATGAQLPPNMKACSSCREVKPHALFHACKAKRDGLQDRCKACRAELDRQRLAQARAAGGRLGGNKSPRKRALSRTQSESDSHAVAKRARGPAAAFKQWAALQWDAPAAGVHPAVDIAIPTLQQQHRAFSVLPDRRAAAAAPTAQAPVYLPDVHARRRYPQWQQGPQPAHPPLTRPAAPAMPIPRMSCSRASAPAAPKFHRPAPPAAQGWQLDADRRLGRIAAVLTSATGFCKTHGVHISEFVVLTGALLLAACVLRHGRAQQAAHSRQGAAQRRQYWHQAAAAMAAQHHRSTAPAAIPHFQYVLA